MFKQRAALLICANSGASMCAMNNVQSIRHRLAMSQSAFAEAIGVTQGNVSHIELGRQEVMPSLARKIIAVAASQGVVITFDDIYKTPTSQEAA